MKMDASDLSNKTATRADLVSSIGELAPKFWRLSYTPVLIIFVASVLYFSPYLTFGKILVGTDDGPRGWRSYGNLGHAIVSFSDKWSPLNGGTAVMERQFGRFLNPTHVLHLFLPKYKQRVFEYIFLTFVAGFSMFCYLRTLGSSRSVATVLGLAFMFVPAFQSYVFAGHYARMQVVAFLPGVMTLTERMLRKASLLDVAALPVLLAWCIYSEHLQLAYFTFLGMGAYFVIRMTQVVTTGQTTLLEGSRRTAYFVAALVIGCLITSMSTFPSMHHTYVTSERAGGVDYAYASSFSLHPEEVVSLVEPDFIGWKEKYWGRNYLKLNSEYFGVLILILAVVPFLFPGRTFVSYLFGGFFFFALLFALGAHSPIHRILYGMLPGMNAFRGPSMMHIWMFFPAFVLAAKGLGSLSRLDVTGDPAVKRRFYVLTGVVGGIALLYMFLSGGFARFWFDTILPTEFQTPHKEQALHGNMRNIETGGIIIFLVVSAFLCSTYRKIHGKFKPSTYLMVFLCLILFDQIRISRPFLSLSAKPRDFFSRQERWEHSIGQYLTKKDSTLYRVHQMFGDRKLYIPGLDLTYVFDDFTNHRYNEIIRILQATSASIIQPQVRDNGAAQDRFRNLLSHLNTKYVLSGSGLNVPGLQEIFASGSLRIYRNTTVSPRVYLASRILKTADPKQTLLELLDKKKWPKATAVVHENASVIKEFDTSTDLSIVDQVSILDYDARKGRISLDIVSSRTQLVVVTDNYSPGWKAFVNGDETEVIPVNYTWKGALLPAGKSHVEFVFDSPVARRWRWVTVVSAVGYALLALGIILWEQRNRKKLPAIGGMD